MLLSLIQMIPVITTLFSAWFFVILYRHFKERRLSYIRWWCIGVFTYGIGTLMESITGIWGWNEFTFKTWYITGALLGGFPLAQGTAYLLWRKSLADATASLFVTLIVIVSFFVVLSPINSDMVETFRLSGKVLSWQKIRMATPFINIYSFLVLVGGAVYSALMYYHRGNDFIQRFKGNLFIAVGGLLPGIGGSFTRFGYTEVLYVTELIGIILIYKGYQLIRNDRNLSVHKQQQVHSGGQ